jgi:hypothetical protein
MSDIGIDVIPAAQVTIADPDRNIYSSWEAIFGFKGVMLTVYVVLWDAGNFVTGSFSSDSPAPIIFRGTCSAATNIDDKSMTVVATSLLNMTQQQFPPTRIQPLCGHNFPINYAAMVDGLNNSDSPFYGCGYSYGVAGGCGNPDTGTAAFTSCDLSFAACVARLGNPTATIPIIQDGFGNPTGRFAGFDYLPLQVVGMQRAYTTGQWDLIINATNEAKYGDYIPLVYGTSWVVPEIMGIYGDGNYNCFESLLCAGQVNSILQNVVNGDLIPKLQADDMLPYSILAPSVTAQTLDNFWKTVNNGGRNGHTNSEIGWLNKGDPYGSNAAIYTHCLVQLVANNSMPTQQVLLQAGFVRTYSSPTTYAYEWSANPVWILLDMLVQATWRYADIDLASFVAAAAVCDEQISFNSVNGNYQNFWNEDGSPPYTRFNVGLTVKQRSSIGQVIQGVRNAFRGMLYFDFTTGLLSAVCKRTLADQQPSAIPGSNFNTPISSVTAAGDPASGYAAYSFDATNILKINGESSLKIRQKTYAETPNKVTTYFFDRENAYNQDISTIVDTEDVNRVGAEVTGTFNLVGPQSFDHINRVTATWFAENYRGNGRLDNEGSAIGDTGGTLVAELMTTIKGVHLQVGQIVLLTDAQNAIYQQTFRIMRIEPSANFETGKITMSWHNDNWYQDSFGQGQSQPIYQNPLSGSQGAPRSWCPNYEVPQLGDAYYSQTELNFGLAQAYGTDAGGNAFAQVVITGQIPVNAFPTAPQRPLVALLAGGDTSGGYPSNTGYFIGLSSMAVDGTMSPLSNIAQVSLSPSQDAIDVIVQAWPVAATGYFAFVGTDPGTMTFQQSAALLPGTVQLVNGYNVQSWGPPDQAFSSLLLEMTIEEHAGVLGTEVLSMTSATIQVPTYVGYGFAVNQFAGRELCVLGVQGDFSSPVYSPIANFPIASNTIDTFTLSAGNPLACNYGNPLSVGDAIVVRFLPTFGADLNGNYFEDLNLVNCLNELGPMYQVQEVVPGPYVWVENTGGTFPFSNGQVVVIQGVQGTTGINGSFTVSGADPTAWTFVPTGATIGGINVAGTGWVAVQTQGLEPNAEVGNLAFIVKGTGRGTCAKIASNTATRVYIVGNWPVQPDSTSRLVILNSATVPVTAVDGISNSNPNTVGSFTGNVLNFGRQALFVQVSALSPTAVASPYTRDPFREIFLFGSQTPRVLTTDGTMLISDSMVNGDATSGSITYTCLPFSQIAGRSFTVSKIDASVNTVTITTANPSDTFENGSASITLTFQSDSITFRVQG